ENRNVHQLVRAKRGEFSFDEEQDALMLTLYDGYAENRDRDDPDGLDKPLMAGSFKKAGVRLPLERFLGRETLTRKLAALNFNDLLDERQRVKSDPELDETERKYQMMRIQTQVQENFAMAYSVLAFAFLAIPLGIKVGRGEGYANFLVAIGLAFVWYFATVIVGWLEKNPDLRPDLLIWLPNIGFQVLGIILFRRVSGR
ncbi:MAG: LptF/LptG family permease, partial [Verrucomicrobiae bacterium]|nr:LptF/LptG family permease [Verrucomicrobiae bacterium]